MSFSRRRRKQQEEEQRQRQQQQQQQNAAEAEAEAATATLQVVDESNQDDPFRENDDAGYDDDDPASLKDDRHSDDPATVDEAVQDALDDGLYSYPTVYDCSRGVLDEPLFDLTVGFDYEYVVALHSPSSSPSSSAAASASAVAEPYELDALPPGLPDMEWGLLWTVAFELGLHGCEVFNQHDISYGESPGTQAKTGDAGTPTRTRTLITSNSTSTPSSINFLMIVAVSSQPVDTIDPTVSSCQYLNVDLPADRQCFPMRGYMKAQYTIGNSHTPTMAAKVVHDKMQGLIALTLNEQKSLTGSVVETLYLGIRSDFVASNPPPPPSGNTNNNGWNSTNSNSSNAITTSMAVGISVATAAVLLAAVLLLVRAKASRDNKHPQHSDPENNNNHNIENDDFTSRSTGNNNLFPMMGSVRKGTRNSGNGNEMHSVKVIDPEECLASLQSSITADDLDLDQVSIDGGEAAKRSILEAKSIGSSTTILISNRAFGRQKLLGQEGEDDYSMEEGEGLEVISTASLSTEGSYSSDGAVRVVPLTPPRPPQATRPSSKTAVAASAAPPPQQQQAKMSLSSSAASVMDSLSRVFDNLPPLPPADLPPLPPTSGQNKAAAVAAASAQSAAALRRRRRKKKKRKKPAKLVRVSSRENVKGMETIAELAEEENGNNEEEEDDCSEYSWASTSEDTDGSRSRDPSPSPSMQEPMMDIDVVTSQPSAVTCASSVSGSSNSSVSSANRLSPRASGSSSSASLRGRPPSPRQMIPPRAPPSTGNKKGNDNDEEGEKYSLPVMRGHEC